MMLFTSRFCMAASSVICGLGQNWGKTPFDESELGPWLINLIEIVGEKWIQRRPELREAPEQCLHLASGGSIEKKVHIRYRGVDLWFSSDKAWALVIAASGFKIVKRPSAPKVVPHSDSQRGLH